MRCIKCNKEYLEGFNYCTGCGNEINSIDKDKIRNMNIQAEPGCCSFCGYRYYDKNWNYCPTCGSSKNLMVKVENSEQTQLNIEGVEIDISSKKDVDSIDKKVPKKKVNDFLMVFLPGPVYYIGVFIGALMTVACTKMFGEGIGMSVMFISFFLSIGAAIIVGIFSLISLIRIFKNKGFLFGILSIIIFIIGLYLPVMFFLMG